MQSINNMVIHTLVVSVHKRTELNEFKLNINEFNRYNFGYETGGRAIRTLFSHVRFSDM
jgi:hypothetical protein